MIFVGETNHLELPDYLRKEQLFWNYLTIPHNSTATEHPSVIIYVCHRVWEVQLLRPESIGLHLNNFVRVISKHL